MYVLFNVVIQKQTASQGKPTRHLVFYMILAQTFIEENADHKAVRNNRDGVGEEEYPY